MTDASPNPAPGLGRAWLLLAAGVTLSVLAVIAGHVRAAGYLLGGTLLAVALLRALLPGPAVGAVAVRSRTIDVLALLTAAGAAIVLATTLRLP